jgi:hypothetical protein
MYTFSDIFDYTWKEHYENGHDYDYYRKKTRSSFLIFLFGISFILTGVGTYLMFMLFLPFLPIFLLLSLSLSVFITSSFIVRHYYLKHKEKVDKGYAAKRKANREILSIYNNKERITSPPVPPANVMRDSENKNNVVDLSNWVIGSEEARLIQSRVRLIQSRVSNDALCSSIESVNDLLELELDKVYREIDLNDPLKESKKPELYSYILGEKFKYLDMEK